MEHFFKPKEGCVIRIIPNMDFASLYPNNMKIYKISREMMQKIRQKKLKEIFGDEL